MPTDYECCGLDSVSIITADVRGVEITRRRIVEDMGYELTVVSESERLEYLEKLGPKKVIFMGDGYHDAKVLKRCAFAIAPANARVEAIAAADFVTPSRSGDGAVMDACIEIERRFFAPELSKYAVCIVAAGKGSRMGEFTKHLNKALLPVHGKPAIAYIVESYPANAEFVIALGYLGEMLQTYLLAAYPERSFTFVDVANYDQAGAGPGYSLLCCKEHLHPFVLANVDALTVGLIPPPVNNWLGIARVEDTTRFCSVAIDDEGTIIRIDDKKKTNNRFAFTGIAGILDHSDFWKALAADEALIAAERQVSPGFQALLKLKLRGEVLEWYDTGVPESFAQTCRDFPPK